MKLKVVNLNYTAKEKTALELAARAAQAKLDEICGPDHKYFVAHIELGVRRRIEGELITDAHHFLAADLE